ncbi:Sec63-domain-containing protein [Wolfiporia cocos MD-104 SS10]|uniref:Sec63-domain-containing protein n=1 Tax=Wolfiporia cocos (strain MD-104) TaxID=742152 RepID=A0A2H3JR50_WOLCO|nr:Sec63-domain-containing protein [Wolfiporia cocos MD-104 SS10]
MSGIQAHLNFLAGAGEELPDNDKRVLDEWIRISGSLKDEDVGPLELDTDEPAEANANSILDVYQGQDVLRDAVHSSIVSEILLKPELEPLLPSLSSILASSRPDEAISEELAEMIGFDKIELVMKILANRAAVVQEINNHLHKPSTVPSPVGKDAISGKAVGLNPQDAKHRLEESLRANAERPLFTGIAQDAPEILPNVYTSSSVAQGNILSHFGTKYTLPLGTVWKDYEEYEEVIVPPAKIARPRATERLIPVSELDTLTKGSFPGYTSLNRIQSIVFPTAYKSNENMLVCAPTGAGKTDVAMLTILRVLAQHCSSTADASLLTSTLKRDEFKIIYVAPMKALASEIVRKLGKRLQWLSISVRELTGDMQMTKAEIAETQIIVTTPEKWDVVTRKPTGEGELASKVRLLIIDEVHLLNDERGAVIETIVARTLRQVESSQSVIRIVGLSATLPNYRDVADFLCVNPYIGLFFFDFSFRPVPLEQHFIGVRGKPGSQRARRNLDKVTFDKVAELVREGHQVMVFVHARKETVKTALALQEDATTQGILDDFSCQDHPQFELFRRDISQSRNKEMRQLFDNGFGIHHAGMLRSDRNMMERMFEARAIKVLCCTATLAWGVNLPAHAVLIKGTQLYDSAKGAFVDLSVLDVLQVFGRAGRPGMEDSGVGYICTAIDKLDHYLDAVTSQNPIESRFVAGMVDALNAEISLGTVANVHDAVQWVGYTYLFVRMRKNPLQYGLTIEQVMKDQNLLIKRNELVAAAAKILSGAQMITLDPESTSFTITDLGRIAAKYYIRYASIEIFNEEFSRRMTEGLIQKMTQADALHMLSLSKEFEQVKVRDSEENELKMLSQSNMTPCNVKDGIDTSQGKVNILLQSYISGYRPDDFALVSDQAYAAQNGARIVRALLEVAISNKWANVSAVLMGMCKAIEKRLWPFHHPLKQFSLKAEVLHNVEEWADDHSMIELASMNASDLGKLVRLNEHHGSAIREAAKQFPTVQITYKLRPLGFDVLKVAVHIQRRFKWNSRIHGFVEPFWLWVEDHEGLTILQLVHLIFRQSTQALDVDFIIAIPGGRPPPSIKIWFVSDKWMGAEDDVSIPLDGLIMPTSSDSHTPRLDIPFLSLSALHQADSEAVSSRLHDLNALQTQSFWSLAKTRYHALLCAPTGCGKSMIGQMVLWQTLQNAAPDSWAIIISPRHPLASQLIVDMRLVARAINVEVELASSETLFDRSPRKRVRVVTATDLLTALSRSRTTHANYSSLRLVLCENLELLDSAYELATSLLLYATQAFPVRFVGLSNSLNDPSDLAAWLGVDPMALHSFRPRDRDQSVTLHTQTFTIHQSAALFKAMAKPAHMAIQETPSEPAIVFVPSRNMCITVARDLITQCALETGTDRGYLPDHIEAEQLEQYILQLQDRTLVDIVNRGVAIFHEGISKADSHVILKLYAEGLVRVLIVPRSSCWMLRVRAATVVVMGTQYLWVMDEERQVRNYSLEELVRMQGRAVRHDGAGHFYLLCQAESKDTFVHFLTDGLPLESKLLETNILRDWYRDRRKDGSIADKQQAADMLSFTFLARRLRSNPVYYDGSPTSLNQLLSQVVDSLEAEADVAGS